MPDGRRRLQEVMAKLGARSPHIRSLSNAELGTADGAGETAGVGRLGFWSLIARGERRRCCC